MTFPGGWELIVILFIVLLIFGGAKLPGLARSMGQSITEFRKASKELSGEGDPDGAPERDADSTSERDPDS